MHTAHVEFISRYDGPMELTTDRAIKMSTTFCHIRQRNGPNGQLDTI